MDLEKAIEWVDYNESHYVIIGLPDNKGKPFRFDKDSLFVCPLNTLFLPVIRVNDTFYHVKYVEGVSVVDYNNPIEYD